jgi:hypothetical protein
MTETHMPAPEKDKGAGGRAEPLVGRSQDCEGCRHGEEFADSDLSAPACKECRGFSLHTSAATLASALEADPDW